MSKSKKGNLLVILMAVLVAAIIYFLFMSETAVAPVPEKDFLSVSPSVVSQSNFQEIKDNQVSANVLMYHHVGGLPSDADDIRKGLTVPANEFEEHLKYLTENDYETLTLGQLAKAIEDKQVPPKVAVLTFDDGYDDNFNEAFPIMKKYNAVGTFFIITSKIGTSEYMNENQIKELIKSGNEIGSHSVTHPGLDKLKGNSLEKEINDSKVKLEELAGQKIISFCYPAGKYNEDTVKALQNAGYKISVTTKPSAGQLDASQMFEVPRYRISSSMNFESRFR